VIVDQPPYWLRLLLLPWLLHCQKASFTKQCELEILAPKRIHIRRNPDPEASIPVSDPEKIVHKRKERKIILDLRLDKYLSLPKYGVTSIDDIEFDVKFEQTLLRKKSKYCLNETLFDKRRF
jgi:hypothetical protein